MDKYSLIENFLCNDDLASYDPYDVWKTSFGKKIRLLYYKNKYLGLAPAAALTFFDLYLNNSARIGYKKQEFPIVRGQSALTLINLFEITKNEEYLRFAKMHIDWLLENSSKGYSGYCWGLNFDWVYGKNEMYDSNTPFSTHTPYPLEAMVKYYQITKDDNVVEPIKSVFNFLEEDIKVMDDNDEILIMSYGISKDRIVANSNSYIMYMYSLLLDFFPDKKEYIEDKIHRIYNFLVTSQEVNGSWYYTPNDKSSFIDCFHSVFILKNILKTATKAQLKDTEQIINKGYTYILDSFLDEKNFLFKRFSKKNKLSITKFDLYDNAEVLNLAFLMKDKKTLDKLEQSIREKFIIQKKDAIYSMIDVFGRLKNRNHLRWAVVPYLFALSNIRD